MSRVLIKKQIIVTVSLILLISAVILCIQSYNRDAYFLNSGNLPYVNLLLEKKFGNDSWEPMDIAYAYWDKHADESQIYTDNLIEKNIRFQYPPETLFIVQFVNTLRISSYTFYGACAYLFLLITSITVYKIFYCLLDQNTQFSFYWKQRLYLFTTVSILTVMYFPILQGAVVGNIQTWLTAMFALSKINTFWQVYLLGWRQP